jgi:hypothetical protein
MSSSSKDALVENAGVVNKMKFHSNFKKHLNGLLSTHIITSLLVLRKIHTSIYFCKGGSTTRVRFL